MAHYGPTNPPEDQGFICSCDYCGGDNSAHAGTVDPETGLMECQYCKKCFEPEE